MADTQDTTLNFKVVGVETLDALAESAKSVKDALTELSTAKVTLGGKHIVKEVRLIQGALDTAVGSYEEASRKSEAVGFGIVPGKRGLKKIRAISAAVAKETEKIVGLQKQLRKKGISEGLEAALQMQVKQHQITVKNLAKEGAARVKSLDRTQGKHMKYVDEISEFREKRWEEHLGTVVESAGDAFKSIADADPFGLAKSAGSFFDVIKKGSASMAAKGGAKGGVMGGMQKGAFKALEVGAKAMATAAKTISAMKGIWDIVKTALDQSADMNAQILDTSGSLSLMGGSWKEFSTGAAKGHALLGQIRSEVTNLDTAWAMNTTPKEQLELLQAFERQNITIREMAATIKEGNTEMKKFTDFTGFAITLQKTLGLESQETVEAISFFTKDMGLSLKEVRTTFHQIAQNAIEANMNTKDFFSTVMQVSTNMALYGNRVGEVAVLLSKLGKALGPRAAKEALSGIVGMWRQMGDEQRIQMTLLAGTSKTLKRVRSDARSQFEHMREDFEKHFGKVGGISGKGGLKIEGFKAEDVANVTDKQIAALNDGTEEQKKLGRRIESLRAMQREIAKGGTTGAANAMAFAGPGAGMQGMFDISEKMFKTPINELTGLNAIAFRKLTGIGMDQFRQLQGLQTQFRGEIGNLAASVDNSAEFLEGGEELSEEQNALLQRLANITGKSLMDLKVDLVNNGGKSITAQDYLASLTEEQRKDAMKNGDLMKSVADQHLSATRKISNILESVIAKVLFEIASFIKGLWDATVNWLTDFDSKAELQALQSIQSGITEQIREAQGKIAGADKGEQKQLNIELRALQEQMRDTTRVQQKLSSGAISSPEQMKKAMDKLRLGRGTAISRDPAALKQMAVESYGSTKFLDPQYAAKLQAQGGGVTQLVDLLKKKETVGQAFGAPKLAITRAEEWAAPEGFFADLRQTISSALSPEALAAKSGRQILLGGGLGVDPADRKKAAAAADAFYDQIDTARYATGKRLGKDAAPGAVQASLEKQFLPILTALKALEEPAQKQALLTEGLEGLMDDLTDTTMSEEDILDGIEKRGIKIDRTAKNALAKAIAAETKKALEAVRMKGVAAELGYGPGTPSPATVAEIEKWQKKGYYKGKPEEAAKAEQLKRYLASGGKVSDAFFPRGGVAQLAPGDYVINQEAFRGPSERAGRGQMLGTAMGRGGRATGGGGNLTIINNINGGDTEKIRTLIMRQIEYLRRKQASTQPV